MTELERLQHAFQAYVHSGEDFAAAIVGDDRAPAERRLRVYYDAYRLRLLEVLRTDFSGLAALLTTAEWREMGEAYLAAHPSTGRSVRSLGARLAGFLGATQPWSKRIELAEMAAFEWAWGKSFDGPDAASLTAASLRALAPQDWPSLRVAFHPTMQRVDLCSNAPVLYQAVASGTELPAVDLGERACCWLLWRRDLRVYWRSVPADEAGVLEAARSGADFAGLCAVLATMMPEEAVPARAVQIVQQWLADGLLSGFRQE